MKIIPTAVCAVVRDSKILFIKGKAFPFEGLLEKEGVAFRKKIIAACSFVSPVHSG